MGYVGRFAPSPTGPLHFGSLVAAMGSFLQARAANGRWLLRIENVDKIREQRGAADCILNTLDHYGFQWDGPVTYQSDNSERYEHFLNQLQQNQDTYACDCTRKKIIQNTASGNKNLIYPGICRNRNLDFCDLRAVKLKVSSDSKIEFIDQIQGTYSQNIATEVGDFNLKRRDGLYAYQLAVVVDDAEQGITEVVRGSDLIDNTPRQIYLQYKLSLASPKYLHLPIALNAAGDKLSKQTFAQKLKIAAYLQQLVAAWKFLHPQNIADKIDPSSCEDFWSYAISNWNIENVPTSQFGFKINSI